MDKQDFQQSLLQPIKCEVCARGAIMLSQIRLGNELFMEENTDRGDERLLKGFNMEAMFDMERCFEHNSYDMPHASNTDEKLANIMLNVLHNGDFNTEDKTDYVEKYSELIP